MAKSSSKQGAQASGTGQNTTNIEPNDDAFHGIDTLNTLGVPNYEKNEHSNAPLKQNSKTPSIRKRAAAARKSPTSDAAPFETENLSASISEAPPQANEFEDLVDFDEETLKILRSSKSVANDAYSTETQSRIALSKASIAVNNSNHGTPWFAIAGAFLWLIGTSLWAFAFPVTQGLPVDELFTTGRIVMYAIATVLPIALFISAAVFVRRAQEMANASRLLAESALRLLDPETLAHGTISSVGGAVRREISALTDGFEIAVARAGELETLVQSEVSSVEAAYAHNEIRLRGLIDALVEQRNGILAEGEALKAVVSESQMTLSNNLNVASQHLNQMVDQVTARTQSTLESKSEEIAHHIMEVSSKVLSVLAERTDDVATSLQLAEKSIVTNIQAAGDNIASSVVERMSILTEDLNSKGERLIDSLADQETRLDTAFNKTAHSVLEAISDRSRDANDSLRFMADTLLTDIMLRGTELTAKWDEVGTQVGQRLSEQSVESAKILIDNQNRLQNLMKTTLSEIESRIQASELRLVDVMKTQSLDVSSSIEQQKKETAERLGQIGVDVSKVIGQQIVEIQSSIESRVENMMTELNTQGSALTEALDTRLHELNSSLTYATEHLESGHTMLNGSIERLQELTAETLTHSTLQLAEILKSTVLETSDELLEKTNIALDAMNNKATDVLGGFETRSSETINEFKNITLMSLDRVDSNIKEFETRIIDSTQNYSEVWNQRFHGFDDALAAKLEGIFAQFDDRVGRIDAAMSQRTEHLNEVFVTSTAALAHTLENGTGAVLNDIESKTGALVQVLDEKRKTLVEHLELHQMATQTVFGSHVKALKSALDETLVGLEEHINKDASLIANTMNLHTLQMVQNIQLQAEQAADVLKVRTDAIDQLVNTDLSNLNAALANNTGTLFTLINEQGQGYIEQLNTNGNALAQKIESSASKAIELLTTTNELFNTTLNSGMTELGKTIIEAHHSIKETLSTQGQQSVEALRDTQVSLSITLADAVEKLNTQNAQLANLVENSQNQLRLVGQELGAHIAQFHEVTSGASVQTEDVLMRLVEQMNVMQKNTQNAIQDAQKVTHEFEAHHTAIAHTIRSIEDSTHSVQIALVDRQQELKDTAQMIAAAAHELDHALGTSTAQITAQLSQTTASIENSVQGAAAKIDDTFNFSSDHADRFSASLARVADQAGKDVMAQFERMTLAASDESMRASEAVKRAYEDVAVEMSKAMRHATQEFSTSTSGLKALVAEVQNEIISTRNTLSSSLKALPIETQESTAELRRVVADQLRALNDLSDLISRQSARVDISVPEPAPDVRPSIVKAKPAPSWFSAAEAKEKERSEIQAEIHQAVAAQLTKNGQSHPQDSSSTANPNWLKELLIKADGQAEEETIEPVLAEKPVATSYTFGAATFGADLAKAVDSEMIADAWARYKRNERNAFNRRLYTVSGQTTFDEVRRRYRRDDDFKTSVDRYIHDFETLISTVAINDKNGELSMSYLTSDTGKVYTLLSHAAGNLN